jgi:hypothetical protein
MRYMRLHSAQYTVFPVNTVFEYTNTVYGIRYTRLTQYAVAGYAVIRYTVYGVRYTVCSVQSCSYTIIRYTVYSIQFNLVYSYTVTQ